MQIRYFSFIIILLIIGFTFSACQEDEESTQLVVVPPPGQAIGNMSFQNFPDMNQEFTVSDITARRTTNGGISFIIKDDENFELICYFPTLRDTGTFESGYRSTCHYLINEGLKMSTYPIVFSFHVTEYNPNTTYPIISGELHYLGKQSDGNNNHIQHVELNCTIDAIPVLPVIRNSPGIDLYYKGEQLEVESEIMVDAMLDIVILTSENESFCIQSRTMPLGEPRPTYVRVSDIFELIGTYSTSSRSINSAGQAIGFRVAQIAEAQSANAAFSNVDFEVIVKDMPYYKIPEPAPGYTVWVKNFGEEVYQIPNAVVVNSAPPKVSGLYTNNYSFQLYFSGDQINTNYWQGHTKLSYQPFNNSTDFSGYGDFTAKSNNTKADLNSFHYSCGQPEKTVFIKGRNVTIQE